MILRGHLNFNKIQNHIQSTTTLQHLSTIGANASKQRHFPHSSEA